MERPAALARWGIVIQCQCNGRLAYIDSAVASTGGAFTAAGSGLSEVFIHNDILLSFEMAGIVPVMKFYQIIEKKTINLFVFGWIFY